MSGSASQPVLGDGTTVPHQRSLLAHLLHALNQPLTGLQCCMELAVAEPQRQEHYVRVLRDGLELTSRMRILVGALRELIDAQQTDEEENTTILLDRLLRDTIDGFRPLAEARNLRLQFACASALPIRGGGRRLSTLLFRAIDSVISMARAGSDLRVQADQDHERAVLHLSFELATLPAYSPFSQPELGLLIAQAEWEQLGGKWNPSTEGNVRTFALVLRLAQAMASENHGGGELK